MMSLIHNTCLYGQHQFDGWVIAKARYSRYSEDAPVLFESKQVKANAHYSQLVTDACSIDGERCQSLDIRLLDRTARVPASQVCRPHTHDTTLCFTHNGLQQFLRESGDANPIHQGGDAIVPGLWILNRLKESYCQDKGNMELWIRFYHPVYVGQDISLDISEHYMAGYFKDITCFAITINHI